MIAARLHAVGDLRVGAEADPGDPPPGWSLVAVTSVGICGSDLHWFTDGGIGEVRIEHPVVPGHEFAAVAVTGPHAGRRVAVDPAIPCESCEMCRAGYQNLCPTVQFAGHGTLDGAMQEQLLWPDHLLFPLPDEISDDGGALLEPLGVAIHAVGLSHLRPGSDVLVVGAGPVGVLASQVARQSGAAGSSSWNPSSIAGRRRCAAVPTGSGRPSMPWTRCSRRRPAGVSTPRSRWRVRTLRSRLPWRPFGLAAASCSEASPPMTVRRSPPGRPAGRG